MNEAKHTPGPWTRGKGKVRVRTEDGTLVAECYTTQNRIRYPAPSEREANACLIEAAPDLLKAAKGCIELLDKYNARMLGEDIRIEILMAIDKAEGFNQGDKIRFHNIRK